MSYRCEETGVKILMWGDAGCQTGFAQVTHNLATRWANQGHDVHIIAINYHGQQWDAPYKLYAPPPYDLFALEHLQEMIDYVNPDVFWAMNDLNILTTGLHELGGKWPVPKTILYVPIDGVGYPQYWYDAVKGAKVVAYTQFGQRVLYDEAGVESDVIYHGVEHDIFHRRDVDKDKRFTVLAVNRNSMRKNYADTFLAFDRFRYKHDDALLVVHAKRQDVGVDLDDLIRRYDLHNHVQITDGEMSKQQLSELYNRADVKISASIGEGFGLTDAESIACGTPVIAQDCSATTEVVGPGGILVKPDRLITDGRDVQMAKPNVDGFVDALERLYSDTKLRRQLGDEGIKHAQQFDWDVAANKFMELM